MSENDGRHLYVIEGEGKAFIFEARDYFDAMVRMERIPEGRHWDATLRFVGDDRPFYSNLYGMH